MLHPIFSTVVTRPDLMADHLSAYAALAVQEATTTGTDLLARVVAWTLGGLFALLFVGLAGTAVMLGVMQDHFHWVLAVVPGVALVLAVAALLAARRPSPLDRFAELRRQFAADMVLLRAAGDTHGS